MGRVEVAVLGPLRAEVGGVEVDLGGSRRRALVARLAVAGGEVVSTDALIEDLWRGETPPKALAALQVHVSHLRRALEPDRPPRGAATVLVSSPPGYALRLDPDALDARRFAGLVDAAAGAGPAEAAELLATALGLWSGRALAEFADEPWAEPEAARLAELRAVAVERLARVRLALGRAAAAVPDLERHVRDHPLREGAVALLATALYRDGRQSDALAVLARTRRRLAAELGVDPGPELRELERDVLAHDARLRPATTPGGAAAPPEPGATDPAPRLGRVADAAGDGRLTSPAGGGAGGSAALPPLVGRADDLARLRAAADAPGGCRLVLVSGDAGAGKSALVEAFRAERVSTGWTTAVGRCPEVAGAPAAWAWRELVEQLVPAGGAVPDQLAPLLTAGPTSPDQAFWLGRAVTELLAGVATAGPVLLVLDDLHRAEDETLQLLRSVVGGLATAPVLVVATVRPAEVGPDLEAALAALAGPIADRVELRGLAEPAVRELLDRQGAGSDPRIVARVTERTGGNPLFVRELARLIATDGPAAAADAVPAGVREVLRRRVDRLPAGGRAVLRQAAVLGRDVEIDVLLAMLGGDEDAALDALELAVVSGLLSEPRAGWVRFAHALVRDTLYGDVPTLRRTRMHAAALAALSAARPDDLAALAHHALAAGPAVAPAEALRHAADGAGAARRFGSFREAARLSGAAIALCGPAGAGPEREVHLRIAHASALANAGDMRAALLARAAAVAAARGGPLLAEALTSYDAPVSWTIRQDTLVDQDLTGLLEAELARPGTAPALRCRLLAALVYELESQDDERVRAASAEAMALSAELGDPATRCVALNARGLVATGPDLHHELAGLGAELIGAAEAAGSAGYRSQGHHLLFQAALARHDLDGAQRHADEAVAGAAAGQLGHMLGWSAIYAGLRALVAGDLAAAEAAYAAVGARLEAAGEPNGALMGLIGLFAVRHAQGRLAELAPLLEEVTSRIPGGPSDLTALALLAAGQPDRAREVWRPQDPYSLNYYWVFFTALRAEVAVGFADRELAARCYADLQPWAGTLAGLASGTVTTGPVAHVLADLAELLDLPDDVRAGHRARGDRVARDLARLAQPKTSRSRRR